MIPSKPTLEEKSQKKPVAERTSKTKPKAKEVGEGTVPLIEKTEAKQAMHKEKREEKKEK